MTRVLIAGDRRWQSIHVAEQVLARLAARYGDVVIVHGACPTGVDAAFEDAARRLRVATEPHPADWSLGPRAGPMRNAEMVRAGAALLIAVHRNLGRSRGSRSCVELALRARIPCWLIASNAVVPERVVGFEGYEVVTRGRRVGLPGAEIATR